MVPVPLALPVSFRGMEEISGHTLLEPPSCMTEMGMAI